MLAGIAMTSVGERPRQSVVTPSLRAILRRPSNVEVKVRCWVCSTAQLIADGDVAGFVAWILFCERGRGPARQASALLLVKKTSRQQAVTPRSAGRKAAAPGVAVVGMASLVKSMTGWVTPWDCQRTRTTSRGVAGEVS
jgi:hypothetical protein